MTLVLLALLVCAALAPRGGAQVKARVDEVVVPVSVRDSHGKFVTNLKQDDFFVLEDGRPQTISDFSIDPQPLSAAIVVDTGMGPMALRRMTPLFISITAGFSAFDEMTSFRYDHLVSQLSDFTSDHIAIEKSLGVVREIAARNRPASGGADTGRLAANGTPAPSMGVPAGSPSHVLNDAIFEAAKTLESRTGSRRRMILIVSDGQVRGTNDHGQQETVRELMLNNIQLYAVLTDFSVVPNRYNALTTYSQETGGDVYTGLRTRSMETAFVRIAEQARNQYVLYYVSNNEIAAGTSVYRTIEVRTRDPKLKLAYRKGYQQKK